MPVLIVFHCIVLLITQLHVAWKTVWILISWLLKKPADQDPHCFQNRGNIRIQQDRGFKISDFGKLIRVKKKSAMKN